MKPTMSMFDAIELGHQLDKGEYKKRERELHIGLLEQQRRLRESNSTLIIIVNGVEGSGKGQVVTQLNTWLDNRSVITKAYWEESDEERERPRLWRFWRDLPARGTTGIMFGSWYTGPILDRAFERITDPVFDTTLTEIVDLERVLSEDGAIIVKFWYHISAASQQARLERDRQHEGTVSPYLEQHASINPTFKRFSERAIRHTDQSFAPWHLIESEDPLYSNIATGEILLEALERRLDNEKAWTQHGKQKTRATGIHLPDTARSLLDRVDLTQKYSGQSYEGDLEALQRRAAELAWLARKRKINTVVVFEGWDVAGKGGAIRRLTHRIDARLYRVTSVAAPTDEEKARHYLWRFWRQVPRAGYISIYDRSWYGRVLVERVEGFASDKEWFRAYGEINSFEKQLTDFGTAVLKFWLHISPDEQLRRFREREKTPWKSHKITSEDWRNREKWEEYAHAVGDMVERTGNIDAPWFLIPANDKKLARLEILRIFCDQMQQHLETHASGAGR